MSHDLLGSAERHSLCPVLYDGWPLAYAANSPAALHLAALLALHPPGWPGVLALPAPLQAEPPLAAGLNTAVEPTPPNPSGRLRWEQSTLPALARRHPTCLIHQTEGLPALLGSGQRLLSPAAAPEEPVPGPGRPRLPLAARLREALGQGGMQRRLAWLWPDDLRPPTETVGKVFSLPPALHPAFSQPAQESRPALQGLDLPESFVLAHPPANTPALSRLLEAWSWAAAPVGQSIPLLILGLEETQQHSLAALIQNFPLKDTLRPLPHLNLEQIAALYWECAAVFHPLPSAPWGGALRWGLACARPVIALDGPLAQDICGPAAYLAGPDARSLGAALISVLVNEDLAADLSQRANLRAASWQTAQFTPALQQAYAALS